VGTNEVVNLVTTLSPRETRKGFKVPLAPEEARQARPSNNQQGKSPAGYSGTYKEDIWNRILPNLVLLRTRRRSSVNGLAHPGRDSALRISAGVTGLASFLPDKRGIPAAWA
jgi:hypothetical protein